MDRDPLNECDGRDETNDQDDLSAEDTKTFLRLHSASRCEALNVSILFSSTWHSWLISAVTDCDKDGDHKKSVPLSSNLV